MLKTTSKSALLSIVTVSMLTFGMPAEVMARGDGGGKVNRPAAKSGGGGAKAANHSVNGGAKQINKGGNKVNNSGNKTVNNVKGGDRNNVNVNNRSNNNVNINVDNDRHGYHGNDWNDNYHPIGTAVAVTAAAVATAAVVGAIVTPNQLPSNCVQVYRGNTTYMQCGSTWYQPQYQGSNVTYVVINQPY